MTKGVRGLARGLVIVAACAAGAHADLLYGTRGSELYRIDTNTLTGTLVGPLGVSSVGGLAFGLDGTLYGLTGSTGELVTIDTTTGAATVVGALGASVSASAGLALDPTTNTLYATTGDGTGIASFLVTVDPSTGASTGVGETGTSALVGLSSDATGVLWGIDGGPGVEELVTIDPATASTTVVSPGGLGAFTTLSALDIGPSGTLWAVSRGSTTYDLVQIDPGTGAGTNIGAISGISVSGSLTALASFDPSFQLYPPGPGAVGANWLNVSGAPPNEPILVFAGTGLGSSSLPGCPGMPLGLAPAFLVSHGSSDGAGFAGFHVLARPALAGLTLHYQAAAPQSCAVTPVVSFTY